MNRAARRAKERTPPPRRHIDPTASLRALFRSKPYSPGDMAVAHIKTRTAFERLRDGGGDKDDFDELAMALNAGLVRAAQIDESLLVTIDAGARAMDRMKDRFLRGLTFGFDAAGLTTVPLALDAYEAITDASSPRQMIDATLAASDSIAYGDVLKEHAA